MMRIGLISDTHGWIEPRAAELFAGVACILHAGDIGTISVIDDLRRIAPVHVVRGNVDRSPNLLALPEHIYLELVGARIHLVPRPVDARPGVAAVIVNGHTHKPLVMWRQGVCWVNPGAAGRRGFHTERTLALMEIGAGRPRVEVIHLGPRSRRVPSAES